MPFNIPIYFFTKTDTLTAFIKMGKWDRIDSNPVSFYQ